MTAWRARPSHGVAALLAVVAVAACGSSPSPPPSGVVGNPTPSAQGTGTASPSGTPTVQTVSGVRTILAPLGLNVRAADAPGATVLGSVAQGVVVTVLAASSRNGGWFQVRGDTVTGWITADPQYSSPRRFVQYQSDARGFSALYPETWTFAERPTSTAFRPQQGPQEIDVTTGPTLDALGPPGRPGYSMTAQDSVEVFGVTGVLRRYDLVGATPSASPGAAAALPHLDEIRLRIDATRAMRIDFVYLQPGDEQDFDDLYHSIVFPPPVTATPTPTH